MFITLILDVITNEITIFNVENDLLSAQDSFLDEVSRLSQSDKEGITYESVFVMRDRVNIYEKRQGWVVNSKQLIKIVTMHSVKEFQVIDGDPEVGG